MSSLVRLRRRSYDIVCFAGRVGLAGLALGILSPQAARPQTPKFFGFASSLQYACGLTELTQKAGVTMATGGNGAIYAGWAATPNPKRAYGIDAEVLVPLVPRQPYQIDGGKWATSIPEGYLLIVVDPERTTLGGHATFRQGKWMVLKGTGTMEHYDTRIGSPGLVASCPVGWFFAGQRRNTPPPGQCGTTWIRRRFGRFQFEFQAAQSAAGSSLAQSAVIEAANPPQWVAVTPCATQTACFGAPGTNRTDLLVRSLPLSDGRQTPAYLALTTAGLDVCSRQVGQGNAAARTWLIPAATAELDRPGFLDLLGYTAPSPATASSTFWEEAEAPLAEFDPNLTNTVLEASPPPPSTRWLTTPALPGFRFQALLADTALVKANACPTQTICFAQTATGAPEIVARILPVQANGKRWPVVGKFATQAAKIWVEQIATHQVRYYELLARAADSPELPGVVDRTGFTP